MAPLGGGISDAATFAAARLLRGQILEHSVSRSEAAAAGTASAWKQHLNETAARMAAADAVAPWVLDALMQRMDGQEGVLQARLLRGSPLS